MRDAHMQVGKHSDFAHGHEADHGQGARIADAVRRVPQTGVQGAIGVIHRYVGCRSMCQGYTYVSWPVICARSHWHGWHEKRNKSGGVDAARGWFPFADRQAGVRSAGTGETTRKQPRSPRDDDVYTTSFITCGVFRHTVSRGGSFPLPWVEHFGDVRNSKPSRHTYRRRGWMGCICWYVWDPTRSGWAVQLGCHG